MSDQTVLATPPAREVKPKAPRTGPVGAWLAWSSLRLPDLWRLRIDIALPMHALMLVAALAAPLLFFWMSGASRTAYCDEPGPNYVSAEPGYTYNVCAGYVRFSDYADEKTYRNHQYTYNTGFESSELTLILTLYAFVCFGLALTWLFYVCRGLRLREIVPVNNRPAFLPVFLLLSLFAVWPILAMQAGFAFTHGGGLGTLLTGTAEITRDDGQLRTIYSPGNGTDTEFSSGFFIFGVMLSLLISISAKLLIFDGLTGLLRAFAVAAIAGLITFAIAYFDITLMGITQDRLTTFTSGDVSNNFFSAFLCGIPAAVFLYAAYKKDVWRGVRRPATRTWAMSFALYAPVWIFLAAYAGVAGFLEDPNTGIIRHILLGFLVCFACIALAAAFLLRGIARLSLLPRP